MQISRSVRLIKESSDRSCRASKLIREVLGLNAILPPFNNFFLDVIGLAGDVFGERPGLLQGTGLRRVEERELRALLALDPRDRVLARLVVVFDHAQIAGLRREHVAHAVRRDVGHRALINRALLDHKHAQALAAEHGAHHHRRRRGADRAHDPALTRPRAPRT